MWPKIKIFSPTYLNALIILEAALHFILPLQQIIPTPIKYVGALLAVGSLALNIYSVWYLVRKKTSSNFFENANVLVVTGPFRRSRNPIYLSGVLLTIGIALFLGSLSTFAIPLLMFIILNYIHIPDEERRLEKSFGKEFVEYKQRVRRWL